MKNAAVAAVAVAFAFVVAIWIAKPYVVGDTGFVLDGSNAFLTCLSNHDYSACGYTGKLNDAGLMTPVGDWPLLQHLPDLAAIGLGADKHATRSRVLELLGVAGVVLGVAAAWFAFAAQRGRGLFWAFMVVLFSGPLLWYGRTTFGEALSAGLLTAFVAATAVPASPVLVALAAMTAAWTKETTYPFLVVLGVLGLLAARRRTGAPIRRHILWGAAGLALGIVAASLFNVVRYGKIVSPNVSESLLHTTGLWRKLEYTAAVFVSPSGGVFVSWLSAIAIVLTGVVLALSRGDRFERRTAIAVIALLVALALGFASWWTPFGWTAYGNRLFVPWGLPLALFVLVVYGRLVLPVVTRLLRPAWRLLLVFAVLLALALPAVGTMWRPNDTARFFTQEQPCERPWLGGVEPWQHCQERFFWADRPMPLYALRGVATAGGAVTTVLVALGLLGCLVLLRGELAPAQQRPVSGTT
jgi:hypothetical protein